MGSEKTGYIRVTGDGSNSGVIKGESCGVTGRRLDTEVLIGPVTGRRRLNFSKV